MSTFDSIYQNKIRQLEEENLKLSQILNLIEQDLPPDPEATRAIQLGKTMKKAEEEGNFQSPGMTPEEREKRRQMRGSELKVRNTLSILKNPLAR